MVVKVGGVLGVVGVRDEDVLAAFLVHGVPVDSVEEGVGHDLVGPVVAEPLGGVDDQELVDEVAGGLVHVVWPDDVAAEDSVKDGLRGFPVEGRDAGEELVHDDAEGPPVDLGAALPGSKKDFRGKVVGGAQDARLDGSRRG